LRIRFYLFNLVSFYILVVFIVIYIIVFNTIMSTRRFESSYSKLQKKRRVELFVESQKIGYG